MEDKDKEHALIYQKDMKWTVYTRRIAKPI